VAALAVLALLGAAASAFRLRAGEALGFGLAISGPRLLLTAMVGAALAASAWLGQRRGADLVQRELLLFGVSAGGAFGGAMWSAQLGTASAVIGALAGAALLAAVLQALYRLPRAWLFLFGLVYAVSWYLCVYGTGYARGVLDAGRARLAFWGGDLSPATWPAACAVAVVVLALITLAAVGGAVRLQAVLETVLLGLAIGAGGPIAFVGITGAGLATFAARPLVPGRQLALAALAGAGALTLADAVQRKLLGGYALAPTSVTAFAAFPLLYLGLSRAKQRREGRQRPWLSAVEAVVVLAITALGWYVVFRLAQLLQVFT
jgi:ABC-type Fe3+-siderophore transport system permease subunit